LQIALDRVSQEQDIALMVVAVGVGGVDDV